MIELTEQQHEALAGESQPAIVLDPKTNETYRLVKSAIYARLQNLIEDDATPSRREVAVLVARGMQEYDMDDPTLELYQHD